MPINRPDGRHWCDPGSETPDESGSWVCPDCGQEWLYDATKQTWETREHRASLEKILEDARVREHEEARARAIEPRRDRSGEQ